MKVIIDDVAKTIEIEGEVNVGEFLNFLKAMNIDTNEYRIIGIRTVWQYPYIVGSDPWKIAEYNPYYTTSGTSNVVTFETCQNMEWDIFEIIEWERWNQEKSLILKFD